jgi:ABC-2 type transport system permease protein
MSAHREPNRIHQTGTAPSGWLLVAQRELFDLWMGGRAFVLLILFSVLLGVLSFLLATNSELSLIPPKEMVFLTLQASIAVGLFISLIIAADSISGERERATLESLLLTPTSRRHIVVGKFLASISPWPAAFLITAPYLALLSPESITLSRALLWGGLLGSVLVAAFTALGMLVSFWSNSNRTSLFVSLGIYFFALLPTQLPGTAQVGSVGQFIRRINPAESTNEFVEKVLVNNRTPQEMASWVTTPVLFALVGLAVLLWYAGPRLRLEAGLGVLRSSAGRALGTLALVALGLGIPVSASAAAQEAEAPTPASLAATIAVDLDHAVIKTGDRVNFTTEVTYSGMTASPPIIVAMNIVNLEGDGDPVDPEDWSPERAQAIEPLAPGQSAVLSWTVRGILAGDYMVYMVAIPQPGGSAVTSLPVSSSGIHLTVNPYARLNPGGVLPLVIGMPIALTFGFSLLRWRRRRDIDPGDTS